ncbi:PREDICTED: uncharacterized protein LOC104789323 [Camelina sativa]|uniref:Uncharacterized protein LOC104789323 n=1 Tax=Camelina sativa TaxID=90675 RepID=A0ABM0ZBM7_CAMSA|nr:PREDICTED: uncharacterized protein LOC104789323 [Camelina sativa]
MITVGESSCNDALPQVETSTDAVIIHTSREDEEAGEEAADLLRNFCMPDINLSDDELSSSSDSVDVTISEDEGPLTEETIRECHFFGPHANYMATPLGEGLDLRIPLQEALEDMCLNFASFNRDAAPTLDEQNEEGRVGMELAIRDVLYEGDELFGGRVFKNKQDCNVKLALHAVNRKFHFRRDHSDQQRLILTCVLDSCPWRVYIVKMEESDNYQIRGVSLEHTCTVEDRSHYHKQATTRVIGSIMKAKYEGNARGPRAIDLQRLLMAEHSVRISYWKAWKSREVAMEGAQGSSDNSYALLPTYLHLLQMANPGSIVDLKTEVDAKGMQRFKYLFLAFGASVEGFQFMKRVIVLDGAHLKGKYGGYLLTASSQDANFQVFPIAFAVVDGENDDAWEWFFRVLITVIPDGETLTFVSDRHSSIYTGLRRLYPRARHGACVVHLQRNVALKFKKKNLLFHVSRAARAYRICDFHTYFNEIIKLSPQCAAYLEAIGFCHWTRAYFLGERYNVMTTNVAESLNAVLKEARELPIISLLEFIRTTLMSWFAMRREAGRSKISEIPPKLREVIHQNFEKSVRFGVKRVDKFEYEVVGTGEVSHYVKLVDRTCSCRAFDLLRLPCPHAISADVAEGLPIHGITAPVFSVNHWRMSYQNY